MKIKPFISKLIRFVLILFTLCFVFVVICLLYIGAPKEMYETSLIKKAFRENKNIESIDRMISQKDFSACFDVYFTTTNKKKFVITGVQIKNKEIVFISFLRTNENFKWQESIDIGDEALYNNLSKVLDIINNY